MRQQFFLLLSVSNMEVKITKVINLFLITKIRRLNHFDQNRHKTVMDPNETAILIISNQQRQKDNGSDILEQGNTKA